MSIELRVASFTDPGRVRDQNEDAVLDDAPLVAVADGMGGHVGGEVASKLALETLSGWKGRLKDHAGHEAAEMLRDAFAAANRAVWQKGRDDEELLGMGTTMTAAWIDDDKMALAHVGDSRAYLLRGSNLKQLTEDQTVAQEWVRRGRIAEDEAASSPHRHILLQAIGNNPEELDIDIATVTMQAGDRVILASDGLYGMVKDPERIKQILIANPDSDAACRALVAEANEAGGEDNISVLIVDAVSDDIGSVDVDAPVAVERPVPSSPRGAKPASRLSRVPRTPLLAILGLVVIIAFGALLVWQSRGVNYVVAERGGNVVVLDGRPGRGDDRAEGEVVRVFEDEPVERFPGTVQRDLYTGIEVDSLDEATEVVERLTRALGPRDTPTPAPKKKATPTPETTLRPKPSP